MKNGLKKAIVFGLSACLAFGSLTGCSKKDTLDTKAAAITVNGTEVPVGVVKFAAHYTQALTEGMYASFMGVPDPFNQDIYGNGTSLGSMVRDELVTELGHMVLAEQKMGEYGVEVTEEEKAAVTEAAKQFIEANDEEVLKKMSADQATVERYLTLRLIQDKMEPKMTEDVDTEVSDEEAAQRKIQYALFVPSAEEETEEVTEAGSEAETAAEEETAASEAETAAEEETAAAEAETAGLTEEETTKTKSAKESESETAEAGTEAESAVAETEAETETETEDPAMAAAKEKSRAQAEELIAKIQAGGELEASAKEIDPDVVCSTMTFGSADSYVAPELIAATEGLEDGALVETPIETARGYYVAQIVSKLDREATDAQKEEIVAQRKSERIAELYTEWTEAGEVTTADELIAKIVFDFALVQETEPAAETEGTTEAESAAAKTEEVTEAE